MGLDTLSTWLQQGLMAWLFALAGLVVYRLVVTPQAMTGMLSDPHSSNRIDAERMQLALAMPVALATYLGEAAKRWGEIHAGSDLLAMPEAPPALLGIVASSQLLFLAGKAYRSFDLKGKLP